MDTMFTLGHRVSALFRGEVPCRTMSNWRVLVSIFGIHKTTSFADTEGKFGYTLIQTVRQEMLSNSLNSLTISFGFNILRKDSE
jgi:hypothetical protein